MDLLNILDIFIKTAHAATEAAGETEKVSGIGRLGLDWKLFIAQLFNFAVIIAILYKWVFKPVGKKLQERSDKIDKALKDAADIESQKIEFDEWKQQSMQDARKEASEIISKAEMEAVAEKEKILAMTKEEQSKILRQTKAQIQSEQKQAVEEAKAEVADLVTTAAEKVLRSKIDEKKDKELIAGAIKEAQE